MIPIRNKRKTLKVTVEEMRNFAFAYVEKYANAYIQHIQILPQTHAHHEAGMNT